MLYSTIFDYVWKLLQKHATVPIHKKGSKSDPSNYRRITLMSCLGFLTILNNRLTQFVTEKNILSDKQLEFVAGNRTSDAHKSYKEILP